MRERIASEEHKESQTFSKTPNSIDTELENNGIMKLTLIEYKCDHCSFEAKSARGLKTHKGHAQGSRQLS